MDSEAQIAFEYLVVLGAALVLAGLVVYISKIVTPGEEVGDVVNRTINKTLNLTG